MTQQLHPHLYLLISLILLSGVLSLETLALNHATRLTLPVSLCVNHAEAEGAWLIISASVHDHQPLFLTLYNHQDAVIAEKSSNHTAVIHTSMTLEFHENLTD